MLSSAPRRISISAAVYIVNFILFRSALSKPKHKMVLNANGEKTKFGPLGQEIQDVIFQRVSVLLGYLKRSKWLLQ